MIWGNVKLRVIGAGINASCRDVSLQLAQGSTLILNRAVVGQETGLALVTDWAGSEKSSQSLVAFSISPDQVFEKNRNPGTRFQIKSGDWLHSRGIKIKVLQCSLVQTRESPPLRGTPKPAQSTLPGVAFRVCSFMAAIILSVMFYESQKKVIEYSKEGPSRSLPTSTELAAEKLTQVPTPFPPAFPPAFPPEEPEISGIEVIETEITKSSPPPISIPKTAPEPAIKLTVVLPKKAKRKVRRVEVHPIPKKMAIVSKAKPLANPPRVKLEAPVALAPVVKPIAKQTPADLDRLLDAPDAVSRGPASLSKTPVHNLDRTRLDRTRLDQALDEL